jgi:hypothetical protein
MYPRPSPDAYAQGPLGFCSGNALHDACELWPAISDSLAALAPLFFLCGLRGFLLFGASGSGALLMDAFFSATLSRPSLERVLVWVVRTTGTLFGCHGRNIRSIFRGRYPHSGGARAGVKINPRRSREQQDDFQSVPNWQLCAYSINSVAATRSVRGIVRLRALEGRAAVPPPSPLIVKFIPPIPATALNTAIAVNVPALGAGASGVSVTAHASKLRRMRASARTLLAFVSAVPRKRRSAAKMRLSRRARRGSEFPSRTIVAYFHFGLNDVSIRAFPSVGASDGGPTMGQKSPYKPIALVVEDDVSARMGGGVAGRRRNGRSSVRQR